MLRLVVLFAVLFCAEAQTQSFDGMGNNLDHPNWGRAGRVLQRMAGSDYEDSLSVPSGSSRPSAREVSNVLAVDSSRGSLFNDRSFSSMVHAWGQFLDHDIDLSPEGEESFDIPVPQGDPVFDPSFTGTQTIHLLRSAAHANHPGTTSPLEQFNTITAYIDASNVYGSDLTRANALRTFTDGRLKMTSEGLLPFNDLGLDNANANPFFADDQLFLAGDVRANENPELAALHTVFVREHNRLAEEIKAANPALTDELIFQKARRVIISQMQAITYKEFLPALLGSFPAYTGYNPAVDASILNEFNSAAFRFGHSMLGDVVQFLDDNAVSVRPALGLRDSFFNPTHLMPGISPDPTGEILKGLCSRVAQEVDLSVIDDLRNFLFGAPGSGAGGLDLLSLNIQRGRDHGLPDYNTVRYAFGLAKLASFADIPTTSSIQDQLSNLYSSVNDIDLWVGLLCEDHVPGGSVGETLKEILTDQFNRLRDGDRFYYENPGVLTTDERDLLGRGRLRGVIRRNTIINNLQGNIFFYQTTVTGTVLPPNKEEKQMGGGMGGGGGGGGGTAPPHVNAPVSLINAVGMVVASTSSDSNGDFTLTGSFTAGESHLLQVEAGPNTNSVSVVFTAGGIIQQDIRLPPPP